MASFLIILKIESHAYVDDKVQTIHAFSLQKNDQTKLWLK